MRTPSEHIAYLDGWRGLAILCVFFGHFFSKSAFWWVGTFGVHLFFVLSGYLMCNILFIKRVELPDFFISRMIRVLPTFLLFIAVLLFYSAFFQPHRFVPSGKEILATVTFLRTYVPYDLGLSSKHWAIGHLWSLNVEEHSYIFLAFIALLGRRAKSPWMTGMLLVAATIGAWTFAQLYRIAPPGGPNDFSVRTEVASLGLLAGATIRYIRHHVPLSLYGKVPAVLPIASVIVAFMCFSTYMYKGWHVTLAPLLLACAINFLDRIPTPVRAALTNPVLRWFGTCSFSLYLWQQPLHVLTADYDGNAFAMCAIAIGIGTISFYAFENPVRKKLIGAWRDRAVTAAAATPHSHQVLAHAAAAPIPGESSVAHQLDDEYGITPTAASQS